MNNENAFAGILLMVINGLEFETKEKLRELSSEQFGDLRAAIRTLDDWLDDVTLEKLRDRSDVK